MTPQLKLHILPTSLKVVVTNIDPISILRTLFPCGDHMVCIIDDREDVWNFAPNLVTVKPYRYFTNTGDINDPFAKAQNNEETKMTEKELVIDKDTLERIKGDKEENGTGESEDAVKQGASSSQETEGAKSSDDKLEENENSDKGKHGEKREVWISTA